mgnify:CR=1 FL=1
MSIEIIIAQENSNNSENENIVEQITFGRTSGTLETGVNFSSQSSSNNYYNSNDSDISFSLTETIPNIGVGYTPVGDLSSSFNAGTSNPLFEKLNKNGLADNIENFIDFDNSRLKDIQLNQNYQEFLFLSEVYCYSHWDPQDRWLRPEPKR